MAKKPLKVQYFFSIIYDKPDSKNLAQLSFCNIMSGTKAGAQIRSLSYNKYLSQKFEDIWERFLLNPNYVNLFPKK